MVTGSGGTQGGYPVPGARIGRFRIVEQLGQGGMGVVYRAVEENLGREVALKIVAPFFAHDPEFRERFSREARAQASLESAHVVAVYAHGEEDGYLYIASQLIVDGDLGQLIRTAGVPPLVDALSVIEQVASGLSDAHEAGLVHRDIKPGNVLVRIRGRAARAYLADFGIARRMDAASTRFGSSVVGTPTYMAPELHGGAEASFRTDVYSLGCLLWVALTGMPPYTGQSDYQIVDGHVNGPIPQLPGDSPMELATNRILQLAMAKDPERRYPTAAAMRADLQAALRLPHTNGATAPRAGGGTAIRPLPPVPPPPVPPPPVPPPSGPSGPGTQPRPAYVGPTVPPGGDRPSPTSPRSSQPPRTRLVALAAAGAVAAIALGVGAAFVLDDGDADPGPSPDPTDATPSFVALPPAEILRASEKEMKVLDTVRVRGQFADDEAKDIAVDMEITADGECAGTMSFVGGGRTELLRKDGRLMIRPDVQFLTDFATENAQGLHDYLGGRWLELDQGGRADFAKVCDLDEFFERDGREGATATHEGVVTEQDQQAVKIHLQEGSDEETYFVMVAEPHYLLRIDETADAWFEYSEFDEPVEVELPAAEDVIKLSEIGEDP